MNNKDNSSDIILIGFLVLMLLIIGSRRTTNSSITGQPNQSGMRMDYNASYLGNGNIIMYRESLHRDTIYWYVSNDGGKTCGKEQKILNKQQ